MHAHSKINRSSKYPQAELVRCWRQHPFEEAFLPCPLYNLHFEQAGRQSVFVRQISQGQDLWAVLRDEVRGVGQSLRLGFPVHRLRADRSRSALLIAHQHYLWRAPRSLAATFRRDVVPAIVLICFILFLREQAMDANKLISRFDHDQASLHQVDVEGGRNIVQDRKAEAQTPNFYTKSYEYMTSCGPVAEEKAPTLTRGLLSYLYRCEP